MARPAWTNVPDANIDLDSALREGDLEDLRDNAAAVRQQVLNINFAEVTGTTVSTPGSKIYEFPLWIPDVGDYTGIDRKLVLWLEVKKATANNANFYLKDFASGGVSSNVQTTSNSYEAKEITFDAMDTPGAWKGTLRTMELWAFVDVAGTAYARSIDNNASRLDY